MYWLTHEELVRRFSDHPKTDFLKAAYAIALDDGFAQEEIDKLDAWRDAERRRTEGGR